MSNSNPYPALVGGYSQAQINGEVMSIKRFGARGDVVQLPNLNWTAGSNTAKVYMQGSATLGAITPGLFTVSMDSTNIFPDLPTFQGNIKGSPRGYAIDVGLSSYEVFQLVGNNKSAYPVQSITANFQQAHASGAVVVPVVFDPALDLGKTIGGAGPGPSTANVIPYFAFNGGAALPFGALVALSAAGGVVTAVFSTLATGFGVNNILGFAGVPGLGGPFRVLTVTNAANVASVSTASGSTTVGFVTGVNPIAAGFTAGGTVSFIGVPGLGGPYTITAITATSVSFALTYTGAYVSGGTAAAQVTFTSSFAGSYSSGGSAYAIEYYGVINSAGATFVQFGVTDFYVESAWQVFGSNVSQADILLGNGTPVLGANITAISVGGGLVTLTTDVPHGLKVSDYVSVLFVDGLTPVGQQITASGTTSITFAGSYSGTYSTGGQVAAAILPNNTFANFNASFGFYGVASPPFAFYVARLVNVGPTQGNLVFIAGCAFGYQLSAQITAVPDCLSATFSGPAASTTMVTNTFAFFGTDDTVAFNTGIAELTTNPGQSPGPQFVGELNHTMMFPAGVYLISETVQSLDVKLVGMNHSSSLIFFDPATVPGTVVFNGVTYRPLLAVGSFGLYDSFAAGIEKIGVYGNGIPGASVVCAMNLQEGSVMDSVAVQGNTRHAFAVLSGGDNRHGDLWVPGSVSNFCMQPMRLTAAITATGAQTGFLNGHLLEAARRGVTQLWVGFNTKNCENVGITVTSDGTFSANFTKTHAIGDACFMGPADQTYGLFYNGVNGAMGLYKATLMGNCSFLAGAGIALNSGPSTTLDIHIEGDLIGYLDPVGFVSGIICANAITDCVYFDNPAMSYGDFDVLLMSISSYSASCNYYDVPTGTVDTNYAVGMYSKTRTQTRFSTGGEADGQLNLDYDNQGALINAAGALFKRLLVGSGFSPTPPIVALGNAASSGRFGIKQDGTYGAILSIISNSGSGGIPTTTSLGGGSGDVKALAVDSFDNSVIIPHLKFADGSGAASDAGGFAVPSMKFGHRVSNGWFYWQQTSTDGWLMQLYSSPDGGVTWTMAMQIDSNNAGRATFADVTSSKFTAAGQVAYYDGASLKPGTPAQLVQTLANGAILTPNQLIAFDSLKLINPTLAQILIQLYGGATPPTANTLVYFDGTEFTAPTFAQLLAALVNGGTPPAAGASLAMNGGGTGITGGGAPAAAPSWTNGDPAGWNGTAWVDVMAAAVDVPLWWNGSGFYGYTPSSFLSWLIGATASGTAVLAKRTTGGTEGSLTIVNGFITALTNPT